jgi:hypothetical protein
MTPGLCRRGAVDILPRSISPRVALVKDVAPLGMRPPPWVSLLDPADLIATASMAHIRRRESLTAKLPSVKLSIE